MLSIYILCSRRRTFKQKQIFLLSLFFQMASALRHVGFLVDTTNVQNSINLLKYACDHGYIRSSEDWVFIIFIKPTTQFRGADWGLVQQPRAAEEREEEEEEEEEEAEEASEEEEEEEAAEEVEEASEEEEEEEAAEEVEEEEAEEASEEEEEEEEAEEEAEEEEAEEEVEKIELPAGFTEVLDERGIPYGTVVAIEKDVIQRICVEIDRLDLLLLIVGVGRYTNVEQLAAYCTQHYLETQILVLRMN